MEPQHQPSVSSGTSTSGHVHVASQGGQAITHDNLFDFDNFDNFDRGYNNASFGMHFDNFPPQNLAPQHQACISCQII